MSTPRRFRGSLATVLATLLAAGLIGFGFDYLGGGIPGTGGAYRVNAVLPTAASLATGARVTMAGVDVGRVASVRRMGSGAVVGLQLNHGVSALPADSRVRVREHTPVGENYVSITPGRSPKRLSSGSELPASQSDEYVDVDQILSVMQGKTHQDTRELIQGVGDAVNDRAGELNATVGGGAQTGTGLARLVAEVHGDRQRVANVIANLGEVSAAAGERGASIMQIGNDGLTTFRALASQDTALGSLLREVPPTLSQVRTTSGTLRAASQTATPVLANLAGTLHALRPSVDELLPAANEGRLLMSELGQTAPRVNATLRDVQALQPPAKTLLPEAQKVLCQVNPALRYLVPYRGDLAGFIENFGSAMNAYDKFGHTLRVLPVQDDDSVAGLPDSAAQASQTLVHSGVLGASSPLEWNPYPKPGQMNSSADGSGASGPGDVLAKTGYVYPRIHADC